MFILGIESSCDETGVALVQCQGPGVPKLLSHALHSQIEVHQHFGGVVPELASRDHIRYVTPLLMRVLDEASVPVTRLDRIAYTQGPGLAGALLVGAGVASALAAALRVPITGVHHLEGHLLSPFLSSNPPTFPFVALLVSGGHTQLMCVKDVGNYVLLGESLDDAAGEAYDKSAKLMGLGYPGGAALASLAASGDPERFVLPRPLLHSANLNFSFAGLKTAVRTQLMKLSLPAMPSDLADLAASTQAAINDVLVKKSLAAMEQTGLQCLVVAGGVGANQDLRARLDRACLLKNIRVHYPEVEFCTDNGAMIAMAAGMRWQRGLLTEAKGYGYGVLPRWSLQAVTAAAPL